MTRLLVIALIFLLVALAPRSSQVLASALQEPAGPYTLSVPVDEVNLTFRASDYRGSPIAGLTPSDLRLLDNGHRQLAFRSLQFYPALPIRAGLLFETSRSMLEDLKSNQEVATLYTSRLLRKGSDRAFVMRFDSEEKVLQDWTDDVPALESSLQSVAADHRSRMGGTAIFDAIYKACRDQWQGDQDTITGNVMLLFTDGLDNASATRISDVASMCQHSRTAIYVFRSDDRSRFSSSQKVLSALVAQTGGRIFFDHTGAEVLRNLTIMEGDQRNQYRLTYKPSDLKVDGAFHRVKLDLPKRGGEILAPKGYYASR